MSSPGGKRRGAIVGFGNVAERAHLPAWSDNEAFEIEAIVEPSPERAARAGVLLPGARIYPDVRTLLERETLDFVDICAPPCDHADLILEASQSRLDVLCEKPLVPTLEELVRVEDIVKHSGRVVFTVNNWKHAPIWEAVTALVDDGAIGAVETVSLSVLRPANAGGGSTDWRRQPAISGGGILLDHGWHHLYLVQSLVGDRLDVAAAEMQFAGHGAGRYEHTVDLHLQGAGVRAHVHLTWRAERRENAGTITGSEGSIALHDDHLILSRSGASDRRLDFEEPLSAGSHHASWMSPVVQAFHRELTIERERGRNLVEAAQCARAIDHAYRAASESITAHARGGR